MDKKGVTSVAWTVVVVMIILVLLSVYYDNKISDINKSLNDLANQINEESREMLIDSINHRSSQDIKLIAENLEKELENFERLKAVGRANHYSPELEDKMESLKKIYALKRSLEDQINSVKVEKLAELEKSSRN